MARPESELRPEGYSQTLAGWLREHINIDPPPGDEDLAVILRAMAVWRSRLLASALIRRYGAVVHAGPFAGMNYVTTAAEGALLPRLIGSYESELHPVLQRFALEGFEAVIDIGCAEGYYAVGLARLMPQVTVHAYDISEAAQEACRDLAVLNGVAERVIVSGVFTPADFETFSDRKCLAVVDCEGAEVDLLRPDLAPSLSKVSLIVETHDLYRRGALATIEERFAATHDIVRIETQPKATPLPPELQQQSHLDQLLCYWEWRKRPTPWLVLTPREGSARPVNNLG